jgi:hypothetical protein
MLCTGAKAPDFQGSIDRSPEAQRHAKAWLRYSMASIIKNGNEEWNW